MDSEDTPAGSKEHARRVKKIAEEWLNKTEKKKETEEEEKLARKEKDQKKETEEEEELTRKEKGQEKETEEEEEEMTRNEKDQKKETEEEEKPANEEKILSSKSIFRPKALAKVSHNDRWSVGSSIAVSQFLRPLFLLRRIYNFKLSLKKAIVFYKPLDTADNQNWSSHAFRTGLDEETETFQTKPPCQNCVTMFANLQGFIKDNTFLGACAEYCPADRLLEDKSLSDEETKQINNALDQNKDICKRYFKNFQEIEIKKRDEALEKTRIVFKEHLFGLRPQCNDHFGDRSRCPYTK